MANIYLKKINETNLPLVDKDLTLTFTDTSKFFITNKDGTLKQITDVYAGYSNLEDLKNRGKSIKDKLYLTESGELYTYNGVEYMAVGGKVESVNGKVGKVILNAKDISYDNTNDSLFSDNLQSVISELDTNIGRNTDDINLIESKIASDSGKVKMDSNDVDSGYLKSKIDNSTIKSIANKLVAISLEGLSSSIDELNYIKGVKSNVQAQIDSLSRVGNFTGSLDSFSDLATIENPNNSDLVIVLEDETRDSVSTLYMFDGDSWVYSGEFKVELRDFTTNPIDLTSEIKGILPDRHIGSGIVKDTQIDLGLLDKLSEEDGELLFNQQNICKGTEGSVSWSKF